MILLADYFFAAVDAVDAYRGGLYGSDDSGMTRKVILGALVVGAIWGILFGLDRLQKRRKAAEKKAQTLFSDLCGALRLSEAEKRRLESVAKKAKLEPMESIFVMPEVFDRIAPSERDSAEWTTLRKRVYGEGSAA